MKVNSYLYSILNTAEEKKKKKNQSKSEAFYQPAA